MPPKPSMRFLATQFGKPFARARFGIKFRQWCDQKRMADAAFGRLAKWENARDDEAARNASV